jgi:hypothetical protein
MYGCSDATMRNYNDEPIPLIFENDTCNGTITTNRADVSLILHFKEPVVNNIVNFLAASPPDYRETYTGSGLPFASKLQAFQDTPNQGTVRIVNNEARIKLLLPNSYYEDFNTLVAPYVDIIYTAINDRERHLTIYLNNAVPYRSLAYPELRSNVMFYDGGFNLPVRTQEQILLESAYPSKNIMPANFWGSKPRQ